MKRALGFAPGISDEDRAEERDELRRYVKLRMAAGGLISDDAGFAGATASLLAIYREQARLLSDHRCGADRRIEDFLAAHLAKAGGSGRHWLPGRTLVLDRHGMARELSIPEHGDAFHSAYVSSYRVRNGVLHNPRHDR
ncbi:MAG: hypothetical protein OXD30_10990, partial [Bryobacterales bacterium]|nr:hypothetical protein [Bryobacterales bacterium]